MYHQGNEKLHDNYRSCSVRTSIGKMYHRRSYFTCYPNYNWKKPAMHDTRYPMNNWKSTTDVNFKYWCEYSSLTVDMKKGGHLTSCIHNRSLQHILQTSHFHSVAFSVFPTSRKFIHLPEQYL